MAAPPYDSGACGNPYELRNETFWGRRSFRLLPESYWNSKCDETPAIDLVLDFMNLRHDRNGEPLSKKLGPVEKHPDGWWRLPIVSALKPSGGYWSTAWHATKYSCLYSIMYHEQLQESNIRSNLRGVWCYKAAMFHKATAFAVFENVFSNGHWWGVLLELMVDRDVGRSVGDRWVQPFDSVRLQALWICGRNHDEMMNGTAMCVSSWDPKAEVNPIKFFPNKKRVYVVQKICEQQVTITTIAGETVVVTIDGNSLEATANDLCALANQACGYDACVAAVLFLDNKLMADDSTFADYMMDCNQCIHEQSGGMEQQAQRAEA